MSINKLSLQLLLLLVKFLPSNVRRTLCAKQKLLLFLHSCFLLLCADCQSQGERIDRQPLLQDRFIPQAGRTQCNTETAFYQSCSVKKYSKYYCRHFSACRICIFRRSCCIMRLTRLIRQKNTRIYSSSVRVTISLLKAHRFTRREIL